MYKQDFIVVVGWVGADFKLYKYKKLKLESSQHLHIITHFYIKKKTSHVKLLMKKSGLIKKKNIYSNVISKKA